MLKSLFSLLFASLLLCGFSSSATLAEVDCPAVANLHKTGETNTSFALDWDKPLGADQYKVWWVRHEDNVTSGPSFTAGEAHTFAGLTAGTYTFYVATVCSVGVSGWVGIEDVISG